MHPDSLSRYLFQTADRELLVCNEALSLSLSLSVPQHQFIQFCKTLYSMFQGDPGEAELFQAIGTVTSLVLQIGEARQSGRSRSRSEEHWSASLEQILASLLTEQVLVIFLERPVELSARISAAKPRQYQERAGLLTIRPGDP